MGDDGGLFGLGLGSGGRNVVLSAWHACQPTGVSDVVDEVLTDTSDHWVGCVGCADTE